MKKEFDKWNIEKKNLEDNNWIILYFIKERYGGVQLVLIWVMNKMERMIILKDLFSCIKNLIASWRGFCQ